ncbi:MAG: hypothetical protein JWM32_1919 [Verrucomicrobia bacterium]|nr:hypothetical protein [Verrucomicrobiota bacterium]
MATPGSRFFQPPVKSLRFTLFLSIFLLVEGVWGLFSPVVFGVFTTNRAHAAIHIALGIAGLLAYRKSFVKSYLGFIGSLLLVVGLLWAVPATRSVPAGLLKVNLSVALLNIVIGIAAIALAAFERPRRLG